jgi:Secretion system C-terminal sorting domain/Bacterial Ig-like domain (group 2)
MMKKFTQWTLAIGLLIAFKSVTFAQAVFTDNYATGVTFAEFGGSVNAISIDNTEKNAGTSSLKVVVPAAGYTGGALKAAMAQNLTAYNAVSFWAKASAAKALNVAGLSNNATTSTFQTEWNAIALTTTWKKYIIPIPNASKLTAETGLFHFAEGAEEGAYTIWFDDIQYETLASGVIGTFAPAMATETVNVLIGTNFSINGTAATVPVNSVNQSLSIAAANFTFTSSNTAVATVSAAGQGTAVAAGTTTITGKLGTVNATGTLTVNVAAATNPPASAPTPTPLAANVISLFSNTYTNVPVDTWSASWDQADVSNFVIGTSDSIRKYTNLIFAGIEFTTKPIDATNMTHFHIDIWSPNATSFKIKLVDFGANGIFGGGDDSEHELAYTSTTNPAVETNKWVSFDIPLSNFTGLKAKAKLAQLILSSSTSTVFVDNVYFYKSVAVVPTNPTTSAPTPTQAAANVISLFSNAYTNVPVDTWSASWDQADVSNFVIGTNDSTRKYTNLVFAGIEFVSKTVNAKDMTHFRMDIWSPDATNFKIKLVDFGANNAFGGGDDSEHELAYTATSTPAIATGKWISFDIPLSSFTGLKAKASMAQLVISSSASTVFVDNVYFYKSTTGTSDIQLVNNLFKAYPSVSDEFLTVEMASEPLNKTKTLTLMNTSGAAVLTQILSSNQTTISTKALPSGLYIVAVRAGEVMQTQKIVIQH